MSHAINADRYKKEADNNQDSTERKELLDMEKGEMILMWAASKGIQGDCNCPPEYPGPHRAQVGGEKWNADQFLKGVVEQKAWEWMGQPFRIIELPFNPYWSKVFAYKELEELMEFGSKK